MDEQSYFSSDQKIYSKKMLCKKIPPSPNPISGYSYDRGYVCFDKKFSLSAISDFCKNHCILIEIPNYKTEFQYWLECSNDEINKMVDFETAVRDQLDPNQFFRLKRMAAVSRFIEPEKFVDAFDFM
jgi:hypothetical protein